MVTINIMIIKWFLVSGYVVLISHGIIRILIYNFKISMIKRLWVLIVKNLVTCFFSNVYMLKWYLTTSIVNGGNDNWNKVTILLIIMILLILTMSDVYIYIYIGTYRCSTI